MTEQTRDQMIGQNVVRLRGSTSQQALADSMRAAGHKWSQATVWAVEKGDRPLRFSEAQDLVRILHGRIDELDRPASALVALGLADEVLAAGVHLVESVYEFLAAKGRLKSSAREWKWDLELGTSFDDDYLHERVAGAEHVEIEDAVRAGVQRWEHVSTGAVGPEPEVHPALKQRVWGRFGRGPVTIPDDDDA